LTLLLDEGHLTNAYPHIKLNGGKNSTITLTYAEALFDEKRVKGNRNEIEGKSIMGIQDQFIADGGRRDYSPLHFRTYRYLQLDIETKDQPLVLEDMYGVFTGYPFQEKASFKSDQAWLDTVWQTGWRTARLCAGETYYDCPYYEQLQYVGDTRIQAMISLYVSGDDRLMKKAIDDISHSFFEDGLTESRYPSRDMQVIPTFSLWWVCMIHDFWMNRKDDAFVNAHLNGIASVLNWYQDRMAANGMLGTVNWWQFVDWAWDRKDDIEFGGVPPGASKGGSSIISLQYAYTLQRAAALMNAFGRKELGAQYAARAKKIAQDVYALCWDSGKNLLADTYEKKSYSQHANVMGILTDAIPVANQQKLLTAVFQDKSITQCTYYFKFYMFEALKKVKMGNDFITMLQPWNQMIRIGLTTFAEEPEPTRSDCHAWSASPNYELLSLVCGVKPASPGFATVTIEPWLGPLKKVDGVVPHPKGEVHVIFEQDGNKLTGEVNLPAGVTGNLNWKGNVIPLKEGKQKITLNSKS
jgi:alpha-L-rhamnosidase